MEAGTITTPFDMTVLNELDRFHLVISAIERLPQTSERRELGERLRDELIGHRRYINEHGRDMPAIRDWVWPCDQSPAAAQECRDCARVTILPATVSEAVAHACGPDICVPGLRRRKRRDAWRARTQMTAVAPRRPAWRRLAAHFRITHLLLLGPFAIALRHG